MTARFALVAFVAALLAASIDAAARADATIPPLARQLSDRGRALHDLGDYEQAIVAYKQAYMIAPSPGLLFNMAQAYRLNGDCRSAAEFYRRYLSTGPEPDARRRAEQQLAIVDSCGRRASASASTGDGSALAVSGRSESETDTPGCGERRTGLVVAGAGGLLFLTGAYFAIDARNAGDQVASTYANGGTWKSIAAVDARGQRSGELATGFVITGGVAVATGVVLYMLGHHQSERASRVPALSISPAARGARVELAWRF